MNKKDKKHKRAQENTDPDMFSWTSERFFIPRSLIHTSKLTSEAFSTLLLFLFISFFYVSVTEYLFSDQSEFQTLDKKDLNEIASQEIAAQQPFKEQPER